MAVKPDAYDKHVPHWVKGFIGAIAGIILIPSIAIISVIKFGGVEDLMKTWAAQQLKVNQPVVASNDNLAMQMLNLSNSLNDFERQVDVRLSNVEKTLAIHTEAINKGMDKLDSLEDWAIAHSANGNVDYIPAKKHSVQNK